MGIGKVFQTLNKKVFNPIRKVPVLGQVFGVAEMITPLGFLTGNGGGLLGGVFGGVLTGDGVLGSSMSQWVAILCLLCCCCLSCLSSVGLVMSLA